MYFLEDSLVERKILIPSFFNSGFPSSVSKKLKIGKRKEKKENKYQEVGQALQPRVHIKGVVPKEPRYGLLMSLTLQTREQVRRLHEVTSGVEQVAVRF